MGFLDRALPAQPEEKVGLCMATGLQTALAVQHPAKLRHGGDKGQTDFCQRQLGLYLPGRFTSDEEAVWALVSSLPKKRTTLCVG